jgi:hypothetical protein
MSQNTRGASQEPDSKASNTTPFPPAKPNHQDGAVDVNLRDRQALVDYFSILQEWSRTQDRRDDLTTRRSSTRPSSAQTGGGVRWRTAEKPA